ncbi:hypothetical protein HZB60_04190 [candidate division KSB1 bacterium]|nr:hypothetical protein [candidate division KSB1 bacterium]
MPILSTELKEYKSREVNNSASNGGRMSANEVVAGVRNNLWPSVSQAERSAGSTLYRKTFYKVANALGLALLTPKIFVETPTPGEDSIVIFPATQNDTQAAITGTERLYGCGGLAVDAALGATLIQVNTEGAALNYFRNGDTLRISNQADVNDVTGIEDIVTVHATTPVTYIGDQAQITLAAPLQNAFAQQATRVASCYMPGDIKASVSGKTASSLAGTYDDVANPITVDHIGGVEQIFTVTFTSTTAFSVVGDTLGSVGGGSTSADFSPVNPDFARAYFTLKALGWGGTWAIGDTLTFTTHPAAAPFWQKRTIPAGTASLSSNKSIIAISGESE